MAGECIDVEFKTVDGVTLRGWLFKGPKNGPAIIVNGGFNSPKEIFVAAVAEWFGRNGVTALVYDYRSIGASDGLPRNDLDPQKMAEDNHDAVTAGFAQWQGYLHCSKLIRIQFLQDDGWVDPKKIAVWGFFYSSMIAIEAAAYDKRVAAVISQGLMPEWYLDPVTEHDTIAQAIEDRANQVRGKPPTYVPLVNKKGEHLLHLKYLANMTDEQKKNLPKWVEGARKHAPSFVDKMTIQSFYRHAKWKPLNNIHLLAPTPVMILTPENDEIVPLAYQKSIFDSLTSEQKRYEIVKDRGHMNFLADVNFDVLLAGQLAFLKDVLKF